MKAKVSVAGKLSASITLTVLLIMPSAKATTPTDVELGKRVYNQCIGCHSPDRNRTGPKHRGVVGRRAGSLEGYKYSQAMKKADIVWDRQTLDAFLANPFNYIPGTTMGFAGIADPEDRRHLITFLEQLTCDPGADQQDKHPHESE